MHAVLVHLELGFVAIGISCYFHKPTNLQEAPTMMARGDMKSCCLELEASQSHITDLAASYSSMVRIFLSSEHATSHDMMKKTPIVLLPWDLDGSFTKSMAANASAPVLGKIWVSMCFVLNTKIILSKSWSKNFNRNTQLHKKHKPWMDLKQVLKRCNFEWESYVPSWCFDGFNIKEPHVHLCVEHPTHDGIRLTGRQKIPWAADTFSFDNRHMVLCFIFEWWLLTNR